MVLGVAKGILWWLNSSCSKRIGNKWLYRLLYAPRVFARVYIPNFTLNPHLRLHSLHPFPHHAWTRSWVAIPPRDGAIATLDDERLDARHIAWTYQPGFDDQHFNHVIVQANSALAPRCYYSLTYRAWMPCALLDGNDMFFHCEEYTNRLTCKPCHHGRIKETMDPQRLRHAGTRPFEPRAVQVP